MADDRGAFEGILLNEQGHICEGTTSNIFYIKDDVLFTPPIGEYVLAGVTRRVILEIANQQGIIAKEENFSNKEIEAADEVFLTNTGIEVLPVCKVDNSPIGNGSPGKLTKFVYEHFLNLIDAESNKC